VEQSKQIERKNKRARTQDSASDAGPAQVPPPPSFFLPDQRCIVRFLSECLSDFGALCACLLVVGYLISQREEGSNVDGVGKKEKSLSKGMKSAGGGGGEAAGGGGGAQVIRTFKQRQVCVCVCVCVCVYAYTHIPKPYDMYIYTHMHMHKRHTHSLPLPPPP
jgi:hypothetical protein